jgi:hypothetical protein
MAASLVDLSPTLQLFRIESERLKLSASFTRRIAEPLDADAAGQATFYCCFDHLRSEYAALRCLSTLIGTVNL